MAENSFKHNKWFCLINTLYFSIHEHNKWSNGQNLCFVPQKQGVDFSNRSDDELIKGKLSREPSVGLKASSEAEAVRVLLPGLRGPMENFI